MSEEKKGVAKIIVGVGLNENLTGLIKESLSKMPELAKLFREREK